MKEKLWEYKHSYYCNEGNYYKAKPTGWGEPLAFEKFDDFLTEWSDADFDMNLVFRWDWERLTPEEYKEEFLSDINEKYEDGSKAPVNSEGNYSVLKLHLMMQRKGCKRFIEITKMEDSDNEKVFTFLKPRFEHLKEMWAPFNLEPKTETNEENE